MATLRLPAASRASLSSRGVAGRSACAPVSLAPRPRVQRRPARLAVRAVAVPPEVSSAATAAASEVGTAVRAFLVALFGSDATRKKPRAPPPPPPAPPAPPATGVERLLLLLSAAWAARIDPLLYEASYRAEQAQAVARLALAVLLAAAKAPLPVFEELGARCVDAFFIVTGFLAVAALRAAYATAASARFLYRDVLLRFRWLALGAVVFFHFPTALIYVADVLKL
jgi:hypothetical protein